MPPRRRAWRLSRATAEKVLDREHHVESRRPRAFYRRLRIDSFRTGRASFMDEPGTGLGWSMNREHISAPGSASINTPVPVVAPPNRDCTKPSSKYQARKTPRYSSPRRGSIRYKYTLGSRSHQSAESVSAPLSRELRMSVHGVFLFPSLWLYCSHNGPVMDTDTQGIKICLNILKWGEFSYERRGVSWARGKGGER